MQLPEKLRQHGFQPVTQWTLREGTIRPETLKWEECGGWLYAFVVDGTVRYIGLTGGVLRSRLDQYTAGKDSYGYESQCGRVKGLIAEQLRESRTVMIYGAKRPDCTKEALAGEERELIATYRDSDLWNVT